MGGNDVGERSGGHRRHRSHSLYTPGRRSREKKEQGWGATNTDSKLKRGKVENNVENRDGKAYVKKLSFLP